MGGSSHRRWGGVVDGDSGPGAAVGTLDMLSAEGGQPNEHQYANLCATETNVKQESAMQQ